MKHTLTLLLIALHVFIDCQVIGQKNTSESPSLSDTLELYPVTIVALHPKAGETEGLKLEYSDRLAHDGGALLNQINGISSIRKSGVYGFDPVLRGFKYDQLNVVINGTQTASAACPNRMDPPTSQMAPNMIQRIEILKGPHGLRYGCSFGGTINFIPLPSQFSENKRVYGRLSGGYESNGNVIRTEGMVGVSNSWSDLALFASWSDGNNYTTGDGSIVAADFMRSSFGGSLGLKLSEKQELKINLTRNLARDVDFPALPMDLRTDDTWLFSLDHEVRFKNANLSSWKTSLYSSLVDHSMDNFDKPLDPRMVNAKTLAKTQNYGGRTEGSWSFERSRLYTGMDFRLETAEGNRERVFLMGPRAGNTAYDNIWQDGQIIRSGLFGEYHILAGGIRWMVSGRMELNASEIKNPDPDFSTLYSETSTTQFNPGISLGGTKQFTKSFSLAFWLGRAQRSGSLTERFINYFPVGEDPFEMLGNPVVDPEINNQADVNLRWSSEKTVMQVDLFAAYLQDFISSYIDSSLSPTIPSSPGVRKYSNIDRAFKTGFEASWTMLLPAGLQQGLSLAYTWAQDLVKDQPLPEIAPLDMKYRLSGNYFNKRLSPYISFRYVLEQNRVSSEFGEKASPSFGLIDLGLSFRLHQIFGITAGVQNLLDVNYYEHLTRSSSGANARPIYAPGRSIFVSFNLDFR